MINRVRGKIDFSAEMLPSQWSRKTQHNNPLSIPSSNTTSFEKSFPFPPSKINLLIPCE